MKKLSFLFVVVFLFAGIGAAWYLATVKLHLKYHPDYISGCNYSEKVNCDTVQASRQSELFGIPIALLGIATYMVMLFLAVIAVMGGVHRGRALSALFSIGLASCLYSVYLALISIFVIKAVCTFCLTMYAVNLAVTIAAFLSFARPWRSLFSMATYFGSFTSWPVTAGIALVFWASFGGVYALYADMRSGMIAEYIKTAEAREKPPAAAASAERPRPDMAASPSKAESGSGTKQAAPAASAKNPQGAKAEPRTKAEPRAEQPSRPAVSAENPRPDIAVTRSNIVPVKTKEGISYMQFSVTAGDHVKGPADAPVTIVEFGDFICGYCKALARDIAPLEKKYEGRVRWVFKHFPMDQDCNPRFKTMHIDACKCARASVCASEQGKFREAHDYLFGRAAGGFSDRDRADFITALGLDQNRFDECMGSTRPDAKIASDVQEGYRAMLSGTPRTYINGYLVAGDVGVEIMDYYIQKSLTQTSGTSTTSMTVPVTPSPRTPAGILLKTSQKPFYIDTFEAAIDKQGRAVSMAGVAPAYASWYMAKESCEKAGKRLCTEEEWETACTGVPAVDNNGNGQFADDEIEGWMFPYGPYYIGGRCNDSAVMDEGVIEASGSRPGCISAQGVYDLTGNLAEWAVSAAGAPVLMGGHLYAGQKASCAFAVNQLGPGIRNEVTGFRCCSDGPAPAIHDTPQDIDSIPLGGRLGMPVVDFSFTDPDGRKINRQSISQGITVITLCKLNNMLGTLELESLQRLKEEFEPRGIRFMAFIVDRDVTATKEMIEALPFKGPIYIDKDQILMGVFSDRKLPGTYIVDGQGILRLAVAGGMNSIFDSFRDSLMSTAGLKERK